MPHNELHRPDIRLRKLQPGERTVQWLLIADPSREMLAHYLHEADLLGILLDGKRAGIAAVLPKGKQLCELMNIALLPEHCGQGHGTRVLKTLFRRYKRKGFSHMQVGTAAEVPSILAFYQKSGFVRTGTRKNFFLKNYPEPIFDNTTQCRDMARLERAL